MRQRLTMLVVSFLSVIISTNALADTKVIFSLNPPAVERERHIPPSGYAQCRVVPSGFYDGVWVNQHRVCHYSNQRGRSVWVSGYWQCLNIKRHNVCSRWEWVPSHWEKNRVVAYGRRSADFGPPAGEFVSPPPPPVSVVVQPGYSDHHRGHHH